MNERQKWAHLNGEQLRRIYQKLTLRIYTSGGCEYGWDWHTIRVTLPGVYNSLRRLVREGIRRAEKGE